jgi:hypothetical protein
MCFVNLLYRACVCVCVCVYVCKVESNAVALVFASCSSVLSSPLLRCTAQATKRSQSSCSMQIGDFTRNKLPQWVGKLSTLSHTVGEILSVRFAQALGLQFLEFQTEILRHSILYHANNTPKHLVTLQGRKYDIFHTLVPLQLFCFFPLHWFSTSSINNLTTFVLLFTGLSDSHASSTQIFK